MPVIPAPTPKTYERAVFSPIRRSTDEERKVLGFLGNHEWLGGVFSEDGQFVEESALVRADTFPILAARTFEGEAVAVDEDVVYGGLLFPNHFGHFLMETLARLWYALQDKSKRFVFHAAPGVTSPSDLNRTFFDAIGLAEDRILIPREPTRFRSITVPAVGVMLGSDTCLAEQRGLFTAISSKFVSDQPVTEGPPIFLSRAKFAPRRVHGEDQLEKLMQINGYRVVRPETMSTADQIKTFNSAKAFCGVVGSALHNLVFTRHPVTVYYIERTRNTPNTLKTFKALDDLMGHTGHYLDVSANSLNTFGQTGPFMIDVQKTQDELLRLGAIKEPASFSFEPERTQQEYEADWQKTHPNQRV